MSTIQTDIEQRLAQAEPDVEVLLAEVVGGDTLRVFIDHPDGVSLELCERVTQGAGAAARDLRARGLLAGHRAPAHQARALPPLRRPPRPRAHARRARRPPQLHRRAGRRLGHRGDGRRRRRGRRDPVRRHLIDRNLVEGVAHMSKEIVEAVHALEREKGISAEKLMAALEDALLSAYKKTPGAAKYARVEMDRDTGDFIVYELIIPERLEAQLIVETIDEGTVVDPETGELREPEEPEIDPEQVRAVPRPDRRARRHAGRLRPHRRADRQAGDPPADPRGRARHDVRGVPRPRRRADHRHRPAVGLALHARAAARARRGAAAQVRAGRRRALRPLAAHQGRHQGGLVLDQGPEHHRLAPRRRS